jgi:hypothetical protein
VFVVPAALYAAWYFGKPGLEGPLYPKGAAKLANVPLIPQVIADGASALLTSIAGLSYSFTPTTAGSLPVTIDSPWGPFLVAAAAVALVFAVRRARGPASLWPWLATLLAFWASIALAWAPLVRVPTASRYVYPAAAIALVLAAEALSPFRISNRVVAIIFAVVALSLGANVALMRDAGASLRSYATNTRANFAAIELARGHVDPNFFPTTGTLAGPFLATGTQAGLHLAAVDRNGSFADTIPELAAAPEQSREQADDVLAEALAFHLAPVPAASSRRSCRRLSAQAVASGFQLPRGGALLRSQAGDSLTLRRFADAFTVQAGKLPAGKFEALRIPSDAAPQPWWLRTTPGHPLTVCSP